MAMRKLILGLVILVTMGDGCNNGVVGVQDYGSVTGRVLDASTNQPIGNALVSVGSLYTGTADAQGAFTLQNIPIGQQVVTARMPGFTTATQTVVIHKERTSQAGYLRLVSLARPEGESTLAPPPTPTPVASSLPTWTPPPTPTPSASPTASPTSAASGPLNPDRTQ